MSRSARIDDAAAEWAARADRGVLDPDEARALEEWLAADPRHLGAYARASAVLSHFDKARALGPDFAAEPVERRAPSRRQAFSAVAATLAVSAGAGAIAYSLIFRRISPCLVE